MEHYIQQQHSIKSWAEEDRPREKFEHKGRLALSNAELIAILLGSGNREETAVDLAKRILAHYDNDLLKLSKVSIKELTKFKGMGNAKAISVLAALEIGRRREGQTAQKVEKVTSTKIAADMIRPYLMDLPHEEFWIMLLSRSNKVIKMIKISSGGISGTIADSRIIFKHAIEHMASAIILAHNHPSGNPKPSQADIKLTKKIVESGKLLDINIIDHIIIAESTYTSFTDEGLI